MDVVKTVIEAFYNPQTGLTRNIAKLKEKNPQLFSIPADTIRSILDQQIEIYQRNKDPRIKTPSLGYKADYVGQLIHADLMFVRSPRNTNQEILIKDEEDNDNRYVLIMVDTYSRYIWAYPVETKSAKEITRLITTTISFIRDFFYNGFSGLKFTVLTDGGKEFSTAEIEKLPNVSHKIAQHHAMLAEAAIYRLRTKIKYLDGPANRKKLDNKTFMNLIKNLNLDSGADAIFEKTALPKERTVIPITADSLFNQGDFVRVRIKKGLFEKKSGLSTFSEQVFVVGDVVWFPYNGVWVYHLVTPDGSLVSKRKWVESDLVKVPVTFMSEHWKKESFTKEEIKDFFLTE